MMNEPAWPELLARLSRQSVLKGHAAFAAIDWDAPENRIDARDPRWELGAGELLGATAWYRSRPADLRARLGLHIVSATMKAGWQFEEVLVAGLLQFLETLPDGAPEARYAYHEIIEESQHILMFREFARRAGLPVPGLPPVDRVLGRRIARLGRTFPELFFVFVLGGEDPIDHVQRQALRSDRGVPPLLRRMMQIHVIEEARHLSFAREYLRRRVPTVSSRRRAALTLVTPVILSRMAALMLRPPAFIIRTYGIPDEVVAEAWTANPVHQARTVEALAKVRALCAELGIVEPRLWRWLGLAGERPAA